MPLIPGGSHKRTKKPEKQLNDYTLGYRSIHRKAKTPKTKAPKTKAPKTKTPKTKTLNDQNTQDR